MNISPYNQRLLAGKGLEHNCNNRFQTGTMQLVLELNQPKAYICVLGRQGTDCS